MLYIYLVFFFFTLFTFVNKLHWSEYSVQCKLLFEILNYKIVINKNN